MAQQEQLDVLDISASAAAKPQLQQRHEDQVDERQDHRTILSVTACDADVPRQTGVLTPFGEPGGHPAAAHGSGSRLRSGGGFLGRLGRGS
jgi:hypothetical protein